MQTRRLLGTMLLALSIFGTCLRAQDTQPTPAPATVPDLSEAALDERVEQLRKARFAVTLLDEQGQAVTGEASYSLKRHRFWFGTAINPSALFGTGKDMKPGDMEKYRDTILKYFPYAVAEGGHRWANMEREARGQHTDDTGLRIYQWCADHDIPMRGHHIFWEPNDKKIEWIGKGGHSTEHDVKERMRHLFTLYDGKIEEWDLNNEILRYRDYHGIDNADLFKWAKEIDPDGTFYLNEHPIVTRTMGGPQYRKYVELIRSLLEEDAPVGGLGVQGHFLGDPLDPQLVWTAYEELAQFNLPIKVTEYDNEQKNEQEQAKQLRHFMKLSFAHPSVEGVLLWGFWGGRHWHGERAALWRKDWSIKPNGQVWVDLVTKEWHTQGKATLDAEGSFDFRGFYGVYDIDAGGRTYRVSLNPGETSVTAKPVAEKSE